jgi:hypothetical protein
MIKIEIFGITTTLFYIIERSGHNTRNMFMPTMKK